MPLNAIESTEAGSTAAAAPEMMRKEGLNPRAMACWLLVPVYLPTTYGFSLAALWAALAVDCAASAADLAELAAVREEIPVQPR